MRLEISTETLPADDLHLRTCEKVCPCGEGTGHVKRQLSSTRYWSLRFTDDGDPGYMPDVFLDLGYLIVNSYGMHFLLFMKFDHRTLKLCKEIVQGVCIFLCMY